MINLNSSLAQAALKIDLFYPKYTWFEFYLPAKHLSYYVSNLFSYLLLIVQLNFSKVLSNEL